MLIAAFFRRGGGLIAQQGERRARQAGMVIQAAAKEVDQEGATRAAEAVEDRATGEEGVGEARGWEQARGAGQAAAAARTAMTRSRARTRDVAQGTPADVAILRLGPVRRATAERLVGWEDVAREDEAWCLVPGGEGQPGGR